MLTHFASSSVARERERVARHIERAERAAMAQDVSSLSRLQRMVRSLLLRELAQYRRDARFPQNRGFAEPTPYFVDAEGTRCAMAHLLEVGGETELVARVARERNNAWVRELADEPRLIAWLAGRLERRRGRRDPAELLRHELVVRVRRRLVRAGELPGARARRARGRRHR
ncbi:hypothetical protein DB32_006578 [Sandaracinus amylolyticus]|uniref:Uncharacterized protein n=1 Tax=Sandaracinus amylolyticus TaxID=927083 RepID=A0A0F6SGX0_9BACT|nr:hypothetical protein DB32_006578 [Sandaracinus amylolyticus]